MRMNTQLSLTANIFKVYRRYENGRHSSIFGKFYTFRMIENGIEQWSYYERIFQHTTALILSHRSNFIQASNIILCNFMIFTHFLFHYKEHNKHTYGL